MTPKLPRLDSLRPGMDHLDFVVNVIKLTGVRKVKTYSGVEHTILEGEITDSHSNISFAVWNEKIEQFVGISSGDKVELQNCFVTSFKGILQVNVGRDSNAHKLEG